MGNESRWIRLNIDWFESEWVLAMSAEAQNCWIKLLCRAKANGFAGSVKLGPIHHLARIWYVGEESVRQMLKAGELSGALTLDGDTVTLVNWATYQGDSTNTERQRRFKSKRKDNGSNGGNALVTEVTLTKTVTKTGTETIPPKPPRTFVKPTQSECDDYAKTIGLPVPESRKLYDFYESKGWKVGRAAMKDWQAAMRNWQRNWKGESKSGDWLDGIGEAS